MWTMRTQGINTLNQFALGDMGGEGAFVSPCLTGLSSWGRLAACPSRRAPAALGTRMSMEAQHQRRAMIRGGLSGVLAGVLGLRVGVARAEEAKPAGGAMVSSGNDKYGYKFEHPDTWKVCQPLAIRTLCLSPFQTHLQRVYAGILIVSCRGMCFCARCRRSPCRRTWMRSSSREGAVPRWALQ